MIVQRVREVVRDRLERDRMAEPSYWDKRVRSRDGHARSVWHAEGFSRLWSERQEKLLEDTLGQLLGGLEGKNILDVGCGTGRLTRWLAKAGANATGVDFSVEAVEAAKAETQAQGLQATFEVADVLSGTLPGERGSFDAVVAVGCLAVACRNGEDLDKAMQALGRAVKSGGLVVLLEPIHTSKLLGRVLKVPLWRWVEAAQHANMVLEKRSGMGFVPVRLAFSSLDAPDWLVEPAFRMGETLLETGKLLRLADYSLLCLRRANRSLR